VLADAPESGVGVSVSASRSRLSRKQEEKREGGEAKWGGELNAEGGWYFSKKSLANLPPRGFS